ncbi:hypothetical protein K435DRAFT_794946 [Dendrothele bispora CBS 962.96]|uniref:Uncharacterized protein n=1 Tax=Dendrothele bispora (strain CBS 962.96) TaxID=1314807 RepID=A0A4S8MAF8_DENBC|nr:hypothetical protein K435DRAFT_794946 [Dendrothele bispora CBS 962.96]
MTPPIWLFKDLSTHYLHSFQLLLPKNAEEKESTDHGEPQTKQPKLKPPKPSDEPSKSKHIASSSSLLELDCDKDLNAESIASSDTQSVDQHQCAVKSFQSISTLSCEEVDIPKIDNENSLLRWLNSSADKLKNLLNRMKSAIENTPMSHHKGQYFNTKHIGAKPAPRTQRKYNATI